MTTKDTASFFENGTSQQFEYCFKLYPQALKLKAEKRCKKPQELIRLDEWYQHELPKLIKARGRDAHLVYDELVQTMKWKQSRGKFYPQLSYLVKVNTPRAVMQETKKAFRKLPNLEQAITALSNLKGVGTTMASALLAAAAPDSAPFMADECLMAIPEIEGIDYTTKEYLNFVQHIQTTMQRLNKQAGGETPQWSPHRVELALWAHYVANDLSPELLDEMPTAAESRDVKANGTSALDGGGGGDTTDVDEESQGAVTLRADNNTATESEPEHEAHSNHRAADGDSNFVSNDSNSQPPAAELSGGPLNDENNTQTTGTNSSDATPLASDSESNLEAPNNEAKLLTNTAAGGDGGGLTTLQHAANNGIAAAAVVAAANGNGAIHALATDSLDSRDDVDDDDDDEDDDDAAAAEVEDDDSNSTNNTNTNTNNSIGKSLTPIINDGGNTNDDSMETTTTATTNTTLSSGAGQKRALHCEVAGAAADEQQQKKLRSD